MIRGLARSTLAAAATLCLTGAGQAADFACLADQCIERINEAVRKTNDALVVAKTTCEEQNGSQRCIYRSSSGPNIHVFFSVINPNAQTILVADARGLSSAGKLYMDAILQAFDPSLDAEARSQFQSKLLTQSATSLQNGGQAQMSAGKLNYALYTNDKLTIISVTTAN
jgi:hypothetical protein